MYMLSSNMNLNIRPGTVRYNNIILVSDSGFSLGKNNVVNAPEKSINKTTIVHAHKKFIVQTPSKDTSGIMH